VKAGLLRAPLRVAVRRYPLFSGGASLVQREPFRRLTPSDAICLAQLRDGGRLFVKSDDFIGRAILLTGDYDPKLTWLCQMVLRPGDTVLDVGANHGVVTAYAARLVGPVGTVHAFEPQRQLAELLARSMRRNAYAQVRVHPFALSSHDGQLPLLGSPSSSATASLEAHGDAQSTLELVRVRRAAPVFESLALGSIRLLKVDIEGHEEAFFRGSLPYLRENTPDVVTFESHGNAPFQARPVVTILRSLGYDLFQVPKALLSMRLIAVTGNETARGFDFVAIRPETGLAATVAAPGFRRVRQLWRHA
jgi:FkbM family methyltransferase